jgi:hypothetical protein
MPHNQPAQLRKVAWNKKTNTTILFVFWLKISVCCEKIAVISKHHHVFYIHPGESFSAYIYTYM